MPTGIYRDKFQLPVVTHTKEPSMMAKSGYDT